MTSALVFGATGLVGSELVELIRNDPRYTQITLVGRRCPDIADTRFTCVALELDQLADRADLFNVDEVFCCLGTTMRKAGSKQAFRKVDYHYVVEIAKQIKQHSLARLLVVSAVNANSHSLSFYARVKGQMETDVAALGLPSVVFMQPSLIEGDRQESRPGEKLGELAMGLVKPMFGWSKASWLSVQAADIAAAMLMSARQQNGGAVRRVRYSDIVELSRQYRVG